jgi:hypothetical protein
VVERNGAEGSAVGARGAIVSLEPDHPVEVDAGDPLHEQALPIPGVASDDDIAPSWNAAVVGEAVDEDEVAGAERGDHALPGDLEPFETASPPGQPCDDSQTAETEE